MTWIQTIDREQAGSDLKRTYERVAGKNGQIDNILKAHSLRPHTLVGHMTLYKSVLHHFGNETPKFFLEAIGVMVSLLNHCDYCVEHHAAGMLRLAESREQGDRAAAEIRRLAADEAPQGVFSQKQLTALHYAKILTLNPEQIDVAVIENLRAAGLSDGEILEINQVVAYFCYANRTVLGLGVSAAGEELGLSPGDSEDPSNWSHG